MTTRTLAISAVFALLIAGGFAVLVFAIGQLRDAGRAAIRAQEAVTVGTELQRSVVSLENGLRGFVASQRLAALEPFRTARAQYRGQVDRLKRLAKDDPALRREAEGIAEQIADYVDLWALPLLDLARSQPEVARSVIVNDRGSERVNQIRSSFAAMFAHARAEASKRERRAEGRSNAATALGILGGLLVLALGGLFAWLLRRLVLRPVSEVAGAAETIASGDLTARVPDTRADEVGDLARAFNAMTISLERKQAELERSNRELEDYAAVTSHDLQGPLVTIGMYAEMLVQRTTEDHETHELALNIRDGAAGMRRLVRELLAYSRLGRRAPRREEVDLNELLREVLEHLAGPIADAGAEIESETLPIVSGEPGRLVQLLQNLLANAIKFSAAGDPHVRIRAREEEGMAVVSFTDNGIGFAPGQAEEIFRPFHRLQSADGYEGTGIGLAVCHKIVTQHGGRIWADGSPGNGATFTFTLPLLAWPSRRAAHLAGGSPSTPHPGPAPLR